jgi:DNA-directed RNA polymerase subunit H (RpoH/RPB5)
MMKIIERTFNAETGEIVDIERNETTVEKKIREQQEAEFAAEIAAAEAKAAEKQAILDRIGLTADELKTILG